MAEKLYYQYYSELAPYVDSQRGVLVCQPRTLAMTREQALAQCKKLRAMIDSVRR